MIDILVLVQVLQLDEQTTRAFEQAAAKWRVCRSGGCVQQRIELSDGTILVWC